MTAQAQALGAVLDSPVLLSRADRLAYGYDGALDRGLPDAVVLARRLEDVRRAVVWCFQSGTPFVARGAGTNLCGASVPLRGGVVLSTAGMRSILSIDSASGSAFVEPGVVNLSLQQALEPLGRFYAPDPASYRVCTLGGNVAQNAGGPRCLKYGVTSDHVEELEAVMPDGSPAVFRVSDPGPDLVGLLVGAEGTLGVVTRIGVRTLPAPRAVTTLLAAFPSIEASIDCVADLVASGVVPRVLEAMDRMTVESIEAYRPAGYPRGEAVLLIETDGADARGEAAAVEARCRSHGAYELRLASEASERERLWEGRRGAYAAVARIAPNVLVEDGVVPRGRLPEAVRRVRAIAAEAGLTVPLLFHAGDGNLHPNIAYDERDAAQRARVKEAGHAILRACVELEGSISGEHGVGSDKRAAMAWLFDAETLALFKRVKAAFDPAGISNPEKLFPAAEPGSRAGARRPLSPPARELVDAVRAAAADRRPVLVAGRGSKLVPPPAPSAATVRTTALRAIRDLDRSNFTVTVEGGAELSELRAELAAEGLHLAFAGGRGTVGGAIASKECAGLRRALLGARSVLSSGEVVELGGKVVKNVAGYDLLKPLLGSWGAYAVVLEATLRLAPRPAEETPEAPRASAAVFVPNRWHRALKSAFDPDNRLNPWVFGEGRE